MWGSDLKVEIIENWKEVIRSKKKGAFKIVHLTMYGESLNTMEPDLRKEDKILVVIGAEKVPREVYDMADYNIEVGNQPHSEISALAVLIDRVLDGKQFLKKQVNAQREIIPTKKGKKVLDKTID